MEKYQFNGIDIKKLDDIIQNCFFFTAAGAEQLDLRTYPNEQDIKESEYMLNITLLLNVLIFCVDQHLS